MRTPTKNCTMVKRKIALAIAKGARQSHLSAASLVRRFRGLITVAPTAKMDIPRQTGTQVTPTRLGLGAEIIVMTGRGHLTAVHRHIVTAVPRDYRVLEILRRRGVAAPQLPDKNSNGNRHELEH
jgi:hypothetical protein